jgi:hypothetical protein
VSPAEGEDPAARGRRKFAAGALEQAAHILGATSASVLVAGLVGPYIAALSGASHVSQATLGEVAGVALSIALFTAAAAIVLRGLSRRANDDGRLAPRPPGLRP